MCPLFTLIWSPHLVEKPASAETIIFVKILARFFSHRFGGFFFSVFPQSFQSSIEILFISDGFEAKLASTEKNKKMCTVNKDWKISTFYISENQKSTMNDEDGIFRFFKSSWLQEKMTAEAVKVIVRCRPMNGREKDLKCKVTSSIFCCADKPIMSKSDLLCQQKRHDIFPIFSLSSRVFLWTRKFHNVP